MSDDPCFVNKTMQYLRMTDRPKEISALQRKGSESTSAPRSCARFLTFCPFLPPQTAFPHVQRGRFTLRYGLFSIAIWAVSHSQTGRFALRYGQFCRIIPHRQLHNTPHGGIINYRSHGYDCTRNTAIFPSSAPAFQNIARIRGCLLRLFIVTASKTRRKASPFNENVARPQRKRASAIENADKSNTYSPHIQ